MRKYIGDGDGKKTVIMIVLVFLVVAAIGTFAIAAPLDGTDDTNGKKDGGLTDCHPYHDAECGYVEAVKGHPCEHVHDKNCGYYQGLEKLKQAALKKAEKAALKKAKEERIKEIKEETGEVLSVADIKDNDVEIAPIDPDKLVTSEMKKEAEKYCTHVHDDSCGYVAEVKGQPCRHSCEKCDGDSSKKAVASETTGSETKAASNTPVETTYSYKVEHYQQNLAGGGYSIKEVEDLVAPENKEVRANAKTYEGFNENNSYRDRVESGIVKKDGSLVLKLYYDRNKNTVYKTEHYQQNAEGTKYILKDIDEDTGMTGASVKAKARTYTGFEENTAAPDRVAQGLVQGDGSLILRLYYDRKDNIKYEIKYYQENQGKDGYTLVDTEEKQAVSGETVTAQARTYAGFTENKSYKDAVYSGTVDAKGQLVLKIYYDRNTDTEYKVQYYKKAYGEKHFKLADTEILKGTTGATVNVPDKKYSAFVKDETNKGNILSGIIAGDGSLTLKSYYTEETTTVNIRKVWSKDGSGKAVKRPSIIQIQLYADEKVCGELKEMKGTGNVWTYTFKELRKYRADAVTEIEYSVREMTKLDDYNIGYGTEGDYLLITNEYTKKALVTGSNVKLGITATNKVTGKDGSADETYTFELMPSEDGAQPMPKGTINNVKTATVKGEGKIDFGDMTFSAPGTYKYIVDQLKGKEDRCKYDDSQYTVTVNVASIDAGEMEGSISYEKDGKTVDEIVFKNAYGEDGSSYSGANSAGAKNVNASSTGTVQTGDMSRAGMYFLIVVTALGILVVLAAAGRKRSTLKR